jgi:hypothetical protein
VKGIQPVMWWHPSEWQIKFCRYDPWDALGRIYAWRWQFGPLEVRKWREAR